MSAPIASALRAQAASLRQQADALDTCASALESAAPDTLLGVEECRALGVGRDALRGAARRGELAVSQGPRGKLLVRRSALEAWLSSRQYKPEARATENASEPDLAAWERSVRRSA
jgi:hypothetical protein